MSISSNIKRLRLSNEWTQEQLADKVGVTRSTVTQWETGWSQPRMGAVEKLAGAFGVSVADIVSEKEIAKLPPNAIVPKASRSARLPLRGRVHAGNPGEPDVIERTVELPACIADAHPLGYFLEVEGDCMDKVYPEGCHILIDPSKEPQNNSVAVVSIDGADYVMRRMLRTANTIVLSPESWNPIHKDVIITADSDHTVELVGTVVWFQSSKEME